MNVSIRNAYDSAPHDADITVFIDVFRASTTLAYLLRNGEPEILGAISPDVVEDYRKRGYLVVSEVLSSGVDNSPSAAGFVAGTKLIQKTGNFSAAVFANLDFNRAISAAFVNVSVVANYLLSSGAKKVDIVACGHFDEKMEAVEDISCAEMLGKLLKGEKSADIPYIGGIRQKIDRRKNSGFPFPPHYWQDLELALRPDTVPVVPVIERVRKDLVSFSAGKL